jgi:protoporphyrinogen oxidase
VTKHVQVLCIGAGPAGLTAARHLARSGIAVTVLEQDPQHVGGISRTETYRGFRFDVGGHRFFSRSAEIEALWDEILPGEFLTQPRKSRIFYNGRLFEYPLQALDALAKLGPVESARCVASYLRARCFPVRTPATFEQWVSNEFGARLYAIFFQAYTEKVWGLKGEEISADWAAQRIKGLSLGTALRQALLPRRRAARHDGPKSLIEQFRYPRLGPGQLWEAAAGQVGDAGGDVLLDRRVDGLEHDPASGRWRVSARDRHGGRHEYSADQLISSAALSDLVKHIRPAAPAAVLAAARRLRYRDFITVALIVRDAACFDDHWIYIHDENVQVGRIQNFRAWSPDLVPDPDLNCLGLEYFCFRGDGLWDADDAALIALARRELQQLGLVDEEHVVDGTVIRQARAYPVYDADCEANLACIREWLQASWPSLHVVGRNGMHRYNNQDHAMMTALLSAENILAGERRWDVWRVNQDAEYLELGRDRTLALGERLVPRRVPGNQLER